MSKKNVIVRVDWRDDTKVIEAVRGHDEVEEAQLTELDIGDIQIQDPNSDDVIVFERKDISDFAGSMTDEDDHLKDQVERLEEATDSPARILIEGNMEDFEDLEHTRVLPQSLRGFTASLEERYGAKIKFCGDIKTLVDYSIRCARKNFEDESMSLRVQSATKKTAPFEKRVYGLIDGVGPTTAQSLYESFPTLTDALEADTTDLMGVDGVGEKTVLQIQDQLRGY